MADKLATIRANPTSENTRPYQGGARVHRPYWSERVRYPNDGVFIEEIPTADGSHIFKVTETRYGRRLIRLDGVIILDEWGIVKRKAA